ncbi:MAG: hydrogenase expression/formation protein HypE [Bacteroidales bacterium]|nr:hydrogenase expression/formation protein HypE [Bacteroidales bacterium]
MRKQEGNILLGHGSGGKMMHDLIESVFMEHFSNPVLRAQTDAALLTINSSDIAFTTDSFVIDPLFFPGGDIGKLAVCGTVNDLAVTGAEPLYLSVSFIIEEGFPVNELEIIARSMALEANKAGVLIVTGDTKVVNRGKCDKLFINSAGIGKISSKNLGISKAENIISGDVIIINGTIGDHGIAVLNARESFNFRTTVESDCTSLNHLISAVLGKSNPKFMRDPTRGGVAAVLNELAGKTGKGIEINESALPVRNDVKAVCEILGFDPLHVANEGKVLIVASEHEATDILEALRAHESGKDSAVIGKIVNDHPGRVVMKNETGGRRIVDTLSGDQLPRIC